MPEEKKEKKKPSEAFTKMNRTVYRNIGGQAVEITPGMFLKPGEETSIRPMRLDFYVQIGAIKEVTTEEKVF